MFARLGRWCYRHRVVVAVAWLIVFMGGGILMGAIGTGYSTEFALPDVESRTGFEILDEHFADSSAAGEGGTIVFPPSRASPTPPSRRR